MDYKVNVIIKNEISKKEKSERTTQFQNAFAIAAADYFFNNEREISMPCKQFGKERHLS